MKRLLLSIAVGVLITVALLFVVLTVDSYSGSSEKSLLTRTPLAWAFYWPRLLWERRVYVSQELGAVFLVNVLVYSLISRFILSMLPKRKSVSVN
jgi:hypothetical protein